jgi:hypothetical protein
MREYTFFRWRRKILMQSVTGYRVHGVAEMLAVGLNLERDVFTKAAVDG